METLSIIIPAYNEEKTIHFILDKIKEVKLVNDINKEAIIVNDRSTDKTEQSIKTYIEKNPGLSINKQSLQLMWLQAPGYWSFSIRTLVENVVLIV